MTYTETQIQSVLNLLNQISTKGIDNAKRIVMIEQILQDFAREDKNNGNDSKEKQPVSG